MTIRQNDRDPRFANGGIWGVIASLALAVALTVTLGVVIATHHPAPTTNRQDCTR